MKKQGFTLVELLVVITIIGMLMSLLIPAVQQAREAGRRAQCSNNQYQLARALQNYESAKNRMPGYVAGLQNDVATAAMGITGTLPVSWFTQILSYMDRADLMDIWSTQNPFGTSSSGTYFGYAWLNSLACPSDPPPSSGPGETPLSYRVNCGYRDELLGSASGGALYGDRSMTTGVFHNNYNSSQPVTGGTEYIISHDGATTTLLLSEGRLDIVPSGYVDSRWVLPYGKQTGTGVPTVHGMQVAEKSFGLTLPPIDPATGSTVTYNPAAPGSGINKYVGMPSSYHPGIVVAAFCDGHVTTLSEEMDQTVYLHIITPFGKRAFEENQTAGAYAWYSTFNPASVGVLDEARIR